MRYAAERDIALPGPAYEHGETNAYAQNERRKCERRKCERKAFARNARDAGSEFTGPAAEDHCDA
jgi:hypothetical protein